MVAVLVTLGAFLAYLVTSPLALLNTALGMWFTQLFAFGGIAWYALRATGRSPVDYTGLRAWKPGAAAFGFLLGTANLVGIATPLQFLSQRLMPESWREIYSVEGLFRGHTPVELALIVVGVGLVAPVCEEFFFRGFFLQGLKSRGGPPFKALVWSAVFFSALHLDPVGFLARVELGLLFGWLWLRTGSLWPSLLAHVANNAVSMALYFLGKASETVRSASPRQEWMTLGLYVGVGLAALGGLVLLARRFPALLGGPPPPAAEVEAPEERLRVEPAPVLLKLAIPWVFAATLSVTAYVVLDPVGVQLSQIDWRYRLKPVPPDAPDAVHAERGMLYELRKDVRKDALVLEAYTLERIRQSKPDWRRER